jgi:hypothetical protein
MWIIGVRNLVVETDTRYIKGMLSHSDIQPSASINQWILSILPFHFTLVHVKGLTHASDGLSRRPRQPDDLPHNPDEEFDNWIDALYGFLHIIQPFPSRQSCTSSYLLIFAIAQISSGEERVNDLQDDQDDYTLVPQSEAAKANDIRILQIGLETSKDSKK